MLLVLWPQYSKVTVALAVMIIAHPPWTATQSHPLRVLSFLTSLLILRSHTNSNIQLRTTTEMTTILSSRAAKPVKSPKILAALKDYCLCSAV